MKKEPTRCWALLRAVTLPESAPTSRRNDFLAFLGKEQKNSQEKNALKAMLETAATYNFKLPEIP